MRRLLAAVALLSLLLAACTTPTPHKATQRTVAGPPAKLGGQRLGGPLCGTTDVTTDLNNYFQNLPDNSTITLPRVCFFVTGSVYIQSHTNITIHGNGAEIEQAANGDGTSFDPVLYVLADTNIKIDNLILDGGNPDYSMGSAGTEGRYGIFMQADNGFLFTHSTVQNMLGDWAIAQFGYDAVTQPPHYVGPQHPNTGLVWTYDTFTNAGYHGFTDESSGCWTLLPCTGWLIAYSHMTNMNVDAMDWEVDAAGSSFNADGTVDSIAQDYVTILDNTWTNWFDDWFASLNFPQVQEQHLHFTGNQLYADGSFFEVTCTTTVEPSPPFPGDNPVQNRDLCIDWTIQNNVWHLPYAPSGYSGGINTSQFEYIHQFSMSNNVIRSCPNTLTGACAGAPNHNIALAFVNDGTIKNNDFTGNAAVFDPTSGGNTVTCTSNKVGAWPAPPTVNTC